MIQYMTIVRDSRDSEVKHIVTSDRPILLENVPEDDSIPKENVQIEEYEFESAVFVRARELINNVDFVREGNNVQVKAKPGKKISAGNFKQKGMR